MQMKLIDKDAVVAEIERLFLPVKNESLGSGNPEVFYYHGLINFLNSLEVKEVDTNKVIKPTEWSEEDEEKFRDVIRLVEQGAPVQSMREHYTNWLKSLKERIKGE